MAIRRIGMCEQAGTGLRMMQREWQALGHSAPINTNDRVHKSFSTFLPQPRDAMGVEAPDLRGTGTAQVTAQVRTLVVKLDGELTRGELQEALGFTHREHFRKAYLVPALEAGVIEMTQPDKPNSRTQRYRLTELGRRVKEGERPS